MMLIESPDFCILLMLLMLASVLLFAFQALSIPIPVYRKFSFLRGFRYFHYFHRSWS